MASWKVNEAAPLMDSQVDLGSDFSSLYDERVMSTNTGSYNASYSVTSSPDDINNISGSVDGVECMSSIKTNISNNLVEAITADKFVSQDKSLHKDSAAANTENPSDPEMRILKLELNRLECDEAEPEGLVSDLESYPSECDNIFDAPSTAMEDVPLCNAILTDTHADIEDKTLSSFQCSQFTDLSQVQIISSPKTFPSLHCWTRKMQREKSMLIITSDFKITYGSTIVNIPDSVYDTGHKALQADDFYSYDSSNSSIDGFRLSPSTLPFN